MKHAAEVMKAPRGDAAVAANQGRAVRGHIRRLARRLPALATVLALSRLPANAQPARALDTEVKATYLFNFGRFTTWPTTPGADETAFSVCVLGHDPFGEMLDSTLAGESIGGKRVVARRIARASEAAGCRILFVSDSERSQLPSILRSLEGLEGQEGTAGALTVSDLPEFAARGGMIQFVVQGNKVRFEVNLTAVERARLLLSSDLLRVATAVRRTGKPGA